MVVLRKLALGFCVGSLLYACGHTSDDHGSSSAGGMSGGGAASSAAGAHEAGASSDALGGAGGEAGVVELGGDAAVGGEAGAAGSAGAAGDLGSPIAAGLVVVATSVSGASDADSEHFVVLIDPIDGSEIARTRLPAQVLGMAHEALRDQWFVFVGEPGQGADDPNATLLVGTMTTSGFEITQSAAVPKPTNQNTIAVLNSRILYRISTHAGTSQIDDTLLLLDTSSVVKAIGKLIIPWKYSLVTVAGAPAIDSTVGGRVFFLHDNLDDAVDNCVSADAGTEDACTVYTSSLPIFDADRDLTLSTAGILPVTQIDRDGSDAALGVQPSGHDVAIVAPPRRAIDTRAGLFRYNAQTGVAVGSPELFSLESATKKLNPTQSITLPGVTLDPCQDRLFTGELANAALLYAVNLPDAAVVPFDPQTKNGIFGGIAYDAYTHTLIDYDSDTAKPTFLAFEIQDSAGTPSFVPRTGPGAAPWLPPAGLVPEIVVVKTPFVPPCAD